MLAAERKVTSKLLEQDTSAEKLYILNEYEIPLDIECVSDISQQHDLCRSRNDR